MVCFVRGCIANTVLNLPYMNEFGLYRNIEDMILKWVVSVGYLKDFSFGMMELSVNSRVPSS